MPRGSAKLPLHHFIDHPLELLQDDPQLEPLLRQILGWASTQAAITEALETGDPEAALRKLLGRKPHTAEYGLFLVVVALQLDCESVNAGTSPELPAAGRPATTLTPCRQPLRRSARRG